MVIGKTKHLIDKSGGFMLRSSSNMWIDKNMNDDDENYVDLDENGKNTFFLFCIPVFCSDRSSRKSNVCL